jgi:hypothetical protein
VCGHFRGFLDLCLPALVDKGRGNEDAVEPSKAGKVQAVSSMVFMLIAMESTVLTTPNGAFCRRSAEESLDNRAQWRQVGIGGLSRLIW